MKNVTKEIKSLKEKALNILDEILSQGEKLQLQPIKIKNNGLNCNNRKSKNMNFRNLYVLLFILNISLLTSCKKFEVPTKEIGTTSAFKELKVDENFTWKTTKSYNLKITGLETINPIKSVFRVESADGQILLEENRAMNESFTLQLDIPQHESKIIVKFGSLEKEITLNSNELNFDYLQTRPEEITE